jgi:anti-anti-sigma regulatory factor
VVIEMPENIGIKNIKTFYSGIKELLNKEAEIILDFNKVNRIDLSLAQVIMAANREFAKTGKKIVLKSVSKYIRKQLFMSGFSE